MATPVIMPRQGQSVESCIIGKWYKKVGDKVSVGEDSVYVRNGQGRL
jgi:pyruvate dehydrogenase E2 component (dihydrolipoamide acetyltransferase)